MRAVLVLFACYFIGAIPIGLIAGKLLKGIDIRQFGSGNIGASNVMRTLGVGPAIVVFIGDVLKGVAGVLLTHNLLDGNVPAHALQYYVVGGSFAAIFGHNCSIFLGFKGGKGVATSLGVIFGFSPMIATIALVLWGILVGITRIISVSSVLASATVPVMMHYSNRIFGHPIPAAYQVCALIAWIFIIIKHRSNYARLMNGTEPRIGQKVKLEVETKKDAAAEENAEVDK